MITIKQIDASSYQTLELLVKLKAGQPGSISLTCMTNDTYPRQRLAVNNGYFRWLKIPLIPDNKYEMEWFDIDIVVAYLSGCPDILETGVRFLLMEDEQIKPLGSEQLNAYFNQPYREQYHFTPFKNWINDPNGLCWFKGNYHLFYQANPFEAKWGNIYWGHAVSKDLIHWTHLPYVLEPQESLWNNENKVGGAFSGSAVVCADDEEAYLFYTRSEESLDGVISRQQQYVCRTKDMIHFSEEELVIAQSPEGATQDFRDPKVFSMNGKWYMVLGGGYQEKAAIFLYESKDLIHWEFLHTLLIEDDPSIRAIECPDCFELDGKYVVLAAWMKHTDEYGRYQMTRYYIGHFEGTEYIIENQGWFDYGSNIYAVQTFQKDGDRIAIGWVSDFYQEHQVTKDNAYGSFSIPRKLWIEKNMLKMETFPQMSELHETLVYHDCEASVRQEILAGSCYHLEADFVAQTEFDILLGSDGDKEIHLIHKNEVTEIRTYGVRSEGVRFPFPCEEIKHLEVFTDRRLIEVFINNGEAAGAKLFYNANSKGIVKAEFENPEAAPVMTIHTMKSIW